MAGTDQNPERTVTEQRIMRTRLPELYTETPRICLLQVRKAQTFSDETEAKRQALEDTLNWDHEDYIESEQGARPEDADPKADVRVCGLGGCTLRIFQAKDGTDIQTGECKAANYCLRDKFKAVGSAATTHEGRAQYREILDTCDGVRSPASSGSFCPRLDCDLSAGVGIDQIPGTTGTCPVRNLVKIEGFDQ